MKDLFIIPQSEKSIIAKVKFGNILEIGKIDIPFNSKSVISENELIVSLCFDTKVLRIFDINGDLIHEINNFGYKALACKENTIFLGGDNKIISEHEKGELFSIIDLNDLEFQLKNIKLPIRVMDGKSIDDILINSNELILVDNVVFPKYILRYDITITNNPIHLDTDDLPNNGTYEHIIKGDINNEWLALFSSTAGMYGSSQYITIEGKNAGTLSTHVFRYDERRAKRLHINNSTFKFIDICLIHNYLFIIRTDGFGYVDLNNQISNNNFIKLSTKLNGFNRMLKTNSNDLILINEYDYELVEL